jgi:hypothetical protein
MSDSSEPDCNSGLVVQDVLRPVKTGYRSYGKRVLLTVPPFRSACAECFAKSIVNRYGIRRIVNLT